jgi:hypothetical protein
MGVPSSPNSRRTRLPVDMPLPHRFVNSTNYTTIRKDIKNIRVSAYMIPINGCVFNAVILLLRHWITGEKSRWVMGQHTIIHDPCDPSAFGDPFGP